MTQIFFWDMNFWKSSLDMQNTLGTHIMMFADVIWTYYKEKKSEIAGFYCSAMCRIDVSYYRFFKEKKTHKSKRRKKYEGIIFFSRNFLKTLFFLPSQTYSL